MYLVECTPAGERWDVSRGMCFRKERDVQRWFRGWTLLISASETMAECLRAESQEEECRGEEEREEEEKEVEGLGHGAGQRKGVDIDSLGSAGG